MILMFLFTLMKFISRKRTRYSYQTYFFITAMFVLLLYNAAKDTAIYFNFQLTDPQGDDHHLHDHLENHCMDINLMACMLSDMYLPCAFMLFSFMVLKLVKVWKLIESRDSGDTDHSRIDMPFFAFSMSFFGCQLAVNYFEFMILHSKVHKEDISD